jgi:phospholipid/cholesterol/gamma-HCH transport system substrate-binding protein
MAKSKKRYIFFGFLAVAIMAVSYWGFNYLKGTGIFSDRNYYFIKYERIDGLDVSSAVTINGYKVGQVTQVKLDDDLKNLIVKIEINEAYSIPDSSVAEIYSMDLMGTKAIQLVLSDKQTYHKQGDILLGSVEASLKDQVSMQMLPIKNQAEDLMKELQNVIEIISYIFNDETRDNLDKSFASIKTTLANLESASYELDTLLISERQRLAHIILNIDNITTTLAGSSEKMTNILSNLSDFSDTLAAADLAQTIKSANDVLANINDITDKINSGEGTLGSLLHNDTLYYNLESTSKSLDKLLTDIRLNPRKYINFSVISFGRSISVTNEEDLSPRDRKYLERQRRKNEKKFERQSEKDQSSIDDKLFHNTCFYFIEIKQSSNKLNPITFKNEKEVFEYVDTSGYHYYTALHYDSNNSPTLLNLYKPQYPTARLVSFVDGEMGYK